MRLSDDVSKWVAREMTDITEDGSVSRIELHHTIEGEGSERLRVYRSLADTTADDLAEDIFSIAEKDAQTRANDMPQRYVLMSFRDDPEEGDADQPDAMHAFVLKGSILATIMGSSTDPPTPAGRQSQDMRHSEALHRLMMQFAEGTAGRLARELDRESKARQHAEDKSFKTIELYEQLLDKKQERELQQAEAQQKARQMDALVNVAISLGTLMMAKFLGAPADAVQKAQEAAGGPPALSGSSRSSVVGKFLTSLTPDEGMGIFGALKASNKLLVQELYKSYQEFPPGSNSFVDAGRDLSIAKLFQGLDKEEITGVLSVLPPDKVEMFKAIYASYYASYEEEQKQKPAPLRDGPTN